LPRLLLGPRGHQIYGRKYDGIPFCHGLFEIGRIGDVSQNNVVAAASQGTLQIRLRCYGVDCVTGFSEGRFEIGIGQRAP
jgi:hypothetical protein